MRLPQKSLINLKKISKIVDRSQIGSRMVEVTINGKCREFTIPNSYTKKVQRAILKVFDTYKFQDYVFSKKGTNYIEKARYHQNDHYLINFDIENYFPSIHFERVIKVLEDLGLDRESSEAIAYSTTRSYRIPSGFVTSTLFSNLIATAFDKELNRYAKKRSLKYSRYVDDLTFSGRFITTDIKQTVNTIIKQSGFKLNQTKISKVYKPNEDKEIVGLVISNGKLRPSEEFYEKLTRHLEELQVMLEVGADILEIKAALLGELNFLRQVNKEIYSEIIANNSSLMSNLNRKFYE